VAASLAVAAGSAAAAPPPPVHVVKDPYYGDTLFHFYQDHYFTSVTGLMVSQHFDRVRQHADEAEVLRGGLLLSYGLHREAGEIFTRLIESNAAPPVRDRAWYYLAKIRYQRGLYAEAQDAIGRIGDKLPPALEEDRQLLQAYLLMALNDYPAAAKLLAGMTQRSEAGLYARYNLGVALVKSGDAAGGHAWLDELGKAVTPPLPPTEEFRSLRDKANVALAFSSLRDEKLSAAYEYLQRVRLDGLQANQALLGLGWSLAAMKRHNEALVPWTELARRDASDAAALEARIAVPYSYAQLGAFGQALQRYQDAIAAFEAESASLDESIVAIRAGKLVDGLLARNPGDEMGWFWNIRELPEMPHASHLGGVLAGHEFQEAFKNLRDLRFLATNLKDWQDKLGIFDDMLANRRQAYADRLPKVLARSADLSVAGLQKRRDEVAAEVARVESETDAAALADERQRDLLERLARVQATLKEAGDDPSLADARERARLVAGALQWQLAQDYSARLWNTQRNVRSIDTELAEAHRREDALLQAQRDEPLRFDAFGKRIAALGPRIGELVPRVASLSQEQQQAVQEIAVAQLTRQKERLAAYTTQARFAVAQLYDRATTTKEPDHAPKP
jgi:hypothetical protein